MKRHSLSQMFNRPVPWLPGDDGAPLVAVSSRIRLARNLADRPFPGRATAEQRQRIFGETRAAAVEIVAAASRLVVAEMPDLGDVERQLLLERRLISRELCGMGAGSGVLLSPDERISVMVNEEDHLRIQALLPGLRLRAAHRLADGVDTELAHRLQFAFDDRLGFLTACPSNVGTGMRASVMLHLPGLALTGQIESLMRGAHALGFAVRGILGEGSEGVANLFQVSNQATLGESEEQTLHRLQAIILKIIASELIFRQRLARERREHLYDHIGKAYGTLRYAHVLTSKDALNHLSMLLLGCDLGLFPGLKRRALQELMIGLQPGHLQKIAGKSLEEVARDIFRARLIRDQLSRAADAAPG